MFIPRTAVNSWYSRMITGNTIIVKTTSHSKQRVSKFGLSLACLWGYSLIVLLVRYPLEVIQLQISKAHWNKRLPYLRFYDIKIHTDFIQNAKWKRDKCVILYFNKSPILDQQLNVSRILLLIRSKDQTQIASSQFGISTPYFNNPLRADEFIITNNAFGTGRVEQIMAATYLS